MHFFLSWIVFFCVMSLYFSFFFLYQLSASTFSFTPTLLMLQTLILFTGLEALIIIFSIFFLLLFRLDNFYWSVFKFAAFSSFISILLLSFFNEFFPSVILYLSFKISHLVLFLYIIILYWECSFFQLLQEPLSLFSGAWL